MATQTQYASSVIAALNYVNGANTYSDDGSYCTFNSASRNKNANIELGITTFSIPTGATINSVTIYQSYFIGTGSTEIDLHTMQISYSGTLRGTVWTEASYPTTETLRSSDTTGTWTVTELNSGNMRVEIDSSRKNSTNQSIISIDVVYVTVDYTPAAVDIEIDCDTANAVGLLTLAGIIPTTISASISVTAAVGLVSLDGIVPTEVSSSSSIDAAVGLITIDGMLPTIEATASIGVVAPYGSMTLSGIEATVSAESSIEMVAAAGEVTISGLIASILTLDTPVLSGELITGYVSLTWT